MNYLKKSHAPIANWWKRTFFVLLGFPHSSAIRHNVRVIAITLLLFTFLISLLSLGCESAKIDNFEAHPKTICPSTTVTLEWSSTSRGTKLSKSPGGDIPNPGEPETGQFEANDDFMDNPGETTTYTLVALSPHGWGSDDREQTTVHVISGGEDHLLGAVGSCSDEGEPVWGATRPPDDWDSQIVVQGVVNESGINVTVTHAGLSFSLPTGAGTDAFNGMTFAGAWKVTPEEIRPTWRNFCENNPGFEGEEGDVAPVPPMPIPAPISEPPPTMFLRVMIGCP